MGNTILQKDYPTAPARGFAGQLVGPYRDHDIVPAKNVEASASMVFGRAVVWKTSSPASDLDVLLPATQNDLVAGILFHQHGYMPVFTTTDIDGNASTTGEFDGTGLIPGTLMAILRKGKILVKVKTGCAVGDRLFIRAVAGGDPEFLGNCENAADSTDMIDCTKQGQFLTAAAAGGLAVLDVNFTAKP